MKVKIGKFIMDGPVDYWFLEASNPHALTHAAEVEITQEEYDEWEKIEEAHKALHVKLAGLYEDSKPKHW